MVPANTGTEAVEAAIKIARAATGRPRVLYAEHAFHGLTLGSLSLNGGAEFREGFGPLLPGCDPVGFGDLDALARELARGDVAAFVVEPIQGKGVNLPRRGLPAGGAAPVPRGGRAVRVRRGPDRDRAHRALPRARALGAAAGPGLRRQGAVRRVRADRRGARVARARSTRVFDGMERAVRHGSTFGGNDLAAAAALATLRVLDAGGSWSSAPSAWARCCWS